MGGMGITREYPSITDLFSGVLGMAGGTQDGMYDEDLVVPYLNGTPYIALNGNHDTNYPMFQPRMIAFQKRVQEIETEYGIKSNFSLVSFDGGHDYTDNVLYAQLDSLFAKQANYYPAFFEANLNITHIAPVGVAPMVNATIDRAFWVQVSALPNVAPDQSVAMNLIASVFRQKVYLNTNHDTLHPGSVTLTLSPKLLNLYRRVKVYYNGYRIYRGRVSGLINDQGFAVLKLDIPVWATSNPPAQSQNSQSQN